MADTVGVLALQGDFARHLESLKRLHVSARAVRWPDELEACRGLILPGGESTTFVNLLRKTGLYEAIIAFAIDRPVMGTCAGLITLSTEVVNGAMDTLGLINCQVERNAYGRQIDSFFNPIRIPMFRENPAYEGVFIRAPRIRSFGADVEALGFLEQEIVMARNRRILVCTFHPELTRDTRVHRYFVQEMVERQGKME